MKTYLGVVDTTGKILRDVTDSNGLPVVQTGRNAVDAQTLWTPGMLYNGSTNDMPRGNTQGPLLASAARTVIATSAVQTNYNAKGIQLILKITAASGTGGLTVFLRSVYVGSVNLLVAPAAIIANGTYIYELYPGSSSAGTAGNGSVQQRVAGALPRSFDVSVGVGDPTSYTYSLDYQLIL